MGIGSTADMTGKVDVMACTSVRRTSVQRSSKPADRHTDRLGHTSVCTSFVGPKSPAAAAGTDFEAGIDHRKAGSLDISGYVVLC